jgi:2-amino-4-hydroxy-6-hydroxymethyldihydropteridine diphosphokinase
MSGLASRRDVHVGLGSNLGDRLRILAAAIADLPRHPDLAGRVEVVRVSRAYETDPVGPPGQGPYLNAAATLRTDLPPERLLAAFLEVERAAGRDRSTEPRNGPRTLDLDLLLDGATVLDRPGLTIPHPRLRERGFVLIPLAEIAPDAIEPVTGESVQSLLLRLPSPGRADPIGPLR